MQVLNLGSVNVDHVYAVDHFVRPGETVASTKYNVFAGGKGFNQSVALARAGAAVRHVGKINKRDDWLRNRLEKDGIDVSFLEFSETATGHAIIQVDPSGENSILLYGGANQTIDKNDITRALKSSASGDYLLLQNEIGSVADAISLGRKHNLRVVFNPAPMTSAVDNYPLDEVDIFILNETEAESLTGEKEPDSVREVMRGKFPKSATVLTLGGRGAVYFDSNIMIKEPALAVKAVDTTAAGDTFIGYFLAELIRSGEPSKALSLGCRAAAICVTIAGASVSIPKRKEIK